MRKFMSKIVFILTTAIVWEGIKRLGNYQDLLFPGVSSVLKALWLERGELLGKTIFSLKIIGIGLLVAVVFAIIGTFLSMGGRLFSEIVMDFMAIMHPLPGIAILPIAILWFGIGIKAILFVIVFSAL